MRTGVQKREEVGGKQEKGMRSNDWGAEEGGRGGVRKEGGKWERGYRRGRRGGEEKKEGEK